jgi:hypothetical protein
MDPGRATDGTDGRGKRRWMRFGLMALGAAVGLSLAVGIPYLVYVGLTTTAKVTEDAYAAQWVALSIVEHMKTHDGAWPKNWEELRPSYRRLTDEAGESVWSVSDLQRRVEVDWRANPQQLRSAVQTGDEPPFKVVRDGTGSHWQGQEPNQIILEYLHSRIAQQDAPPPPTR